MPQAYIARHGAMRLLGRFEADVPYGRGQKVVLQTERGLEVGEVLCLATERALALIPNPSQGQILRCLNAADEARLANLHQAEQEEFETCQRFIVQRRLLMQLVQVEHLFGGERIIFYYLAEKRVDFRELVKDLARHYRTRIEMRQIGVRDEARLLADYGDCGKPVCCNTHLTVLPPVTMRMAKLQKTTLDPAKISGRCGRLKCCLRYEYEVYEEHQRQLPAPGSTIRTASGPGRVLVQEILARKVLVELTDGRRLLLGPEDILPAADAPPAGPVQAPSAEPPADLQ